MTYDEVLQERSDTDKLSTTLEYLLMTIDDAETLEEVLHSEEYKEAKTLVKQLCY